MFLNRKGLVGFAPSDWVEWVSLIILFSSPWTKLYLFGFQSGGHFLFVFVLSYLIATALNT